MSSVPLQSLLAMSPEKRKLAAQEKQPSGPLPEEQPREKLHTLEEFSYEFFRCPPPGLPWAAGSREGLLAGRGPPALLQPPWEVGGGQSGSTGRRGLQAGPHSSPHPRQGPGKGDSQQSHAARGPRPGPPVGLFPGAAAAAPAQVRP